MTSFNWTITSLTSDTAPEERAGGVVKAFWLCVVNDSGYTASNYGVALFTFDPDAAGYTPYDNLTEDQVLGWCWAPTIDAEGEESDPQVNKDTIEASLQSIVGRRKNTARGVPWEVEMYSGEESE